MVRRRPRRASARCGTRWAAPASASTACGPPRPTLENTFVAILRELEPPRPVPAVSRPATRHAGGPRGGHRRPRPAQDLRRLRRGQGHRPRGRATARSTVCSAPTARARRPRSRCSAGWSSRARARSSWPARPERAALRRPCGSRWATCRRSSRSTTTSRSTRTSTSSPASTRCRRSGAPSESAGCSSSPASRGRGGQLTGQPAGRMEAARGVRRGDHARAARALSRRADVRRRSRSRAAPSGP